MTQPKPWELPEGTTTLASMAAIHSGLAGGGCGDCPPQQR